MALDTGLEASVPLPTSDLVSHLPGTSLQLYIRFLINTLTIPFVFFSHLVYNAPGKLSQRNRWSDLEYHSQKRGQRWHDSDAPSASTLKRG